MAYDLPRAHEIVQMLLQGAIPINKAEDHVRAQACNVFGQDYDPNATLLLQAINGYDEVRQHTSDGIIIASTEEDIPTVSNTPHTRSMVCVRPNQPLQAISISTITSLDGQQRKKIRRF